MRLRGQRRAAPRRGRAGEAPPRGQVRSCPWRLVDASERFLAALAGVTDPERKRKIIGALFIDVFDEEAARLGGFDFLAQGTLYPDVIESVSVVGPSAAIKSHHNVGGLPETMRLTLVEPLRQLFKDEVRALGRALGLDEEFVTRQPFPGPGLAVRIVGEVTRDRLDLLRRADAVVVDEIRRQGWYDRLWQSFAVLLPVRSVGVMGDERTYDYTIAVRAVESLDGMTADWARLPHDLLATISSRLVNEVAASTVSCTTSVRSRRRRSSGSSMPEFVHLHLHTEYSLLDGACRIGELLAEAERLKMPALAVTEHGNLFSSIVFHDKARKRGIKPILGCEVYVAPGSRLTKSGPSSETANHLILLAETNEGFHNLVKLTSSAYTEGFYYKPRIDKDLLARHSTGLIALSSCLKGEVPSALRADQFESAARAAATYRDILGAGNFFLELQYQGIEEQRVVNNGLLPLSRDSGHAAGLHERRALPAARRLPPARHPAVHRHGQDGERRRADAVLRRPVLPEDARGDGGGLRPRARGDAQHGGHRRALQRRPVGLGAVPAEFPGARGLHAGGLLRARRPRGLRDAPARGCRTCARPARCAAAIEDYRARLQYEIDVIKRMQYPGTS